MLSFIIFISSTTNKVTRFLKNKFPFVLYFDDFTDRVPQSIEFKDTYATDGKLTKGRKKEWQEIIEEVFKRSNQENLNKTQKPLQAYMSVDNEDRKTDILSVLLNHYLCIYIRCCLIIL
jgi:hypothetical protein